MANGRVDIIIKRLKTGIPKLGWISGDWMSIGNPGAFPELGSNYVPVETSFCDLKKVFRHPKTPVESCQNLLGRQDFKSGIEVSGTRRKGSNRFCA